MYTEGKEEERMRDQKRGILSFLSREGAGGEEENQEQKRGADSSGGCGGGCGGVMRR